MMFIIKFEYNYSYSRDTCVAYAKMEGAPVTLVHEAELAASRGVPL